MATYNWYCPECGREDYEDFEEAKPPKVCDTCGAELCKMEPESDDESKSESDK
jgi:rRNA maturation endonuclease Nob1